VQAGYGWIHRAAHLLTNAEQQSANEVQQNYQSLLDEMQQEACTSEPLQKMITTFLKVTDSYWPGLFLCYDVSDLPRTNNDLEHIFGSTRYHERRATVKLNKVRLKKQTSTHKIKMSLKGHLAFFSCGFVTHRVYLRERSTCG
jgi:hypothetical protein